ncbi:MAG: alginate lyase family protein [Nitrospira sp.]
MKPFTRDLFWLYLRTATYLRPIQFIHLIRNRLHLNSRKLPSNPRVRLRSGVGFNTGITEGHRAHDDDSFIFLNTARSFPNGIPDWVCRDMPKLWRYNLHYFDYLHDSRRSFESKCLLISDWIRCNPPGTEDAWEPYTVSLRIVNWIKFLLLINDREARREPLPPPDWTNSLYHQALWLERHIEYHLLANHYLKNGVALLFAGMYFEGIDADRWLEKGREIVQSELKEQFLADGGHFERSPMYHSISVVDYLDVLNLVQTSSAAISCELADHVANQTTRALDFLNGICMPDGAIPLFNDSAFGIAPTPDQIFAYAEKVMGYKTSSLSNGMVVRSFPSSGYYACQMADDMIIVDCGVIGPDYQPGHAHCDTLSYELAIDGRRVVVDSGVCDYEPSQERAYARSTRAHNTVVVDGMEQSEIWGVFRVARRARPILGRIDTTESQSVLFEGAHDGYRRLHGKPIHRRTISYDGRGSWVIADIVEGSGTHRMESLVHIHPDCTVVEAGACCVSIERCGEPIATIEALGTCRMTIERGCYFSEFGLSRKNPVIAFSCSGDVPLQLSYRIQKVKDDRTKSHRHANPLSLTLLPSRGECTGNENL